MTARPPVALVMTWMAIAIVGGCDRGRETREPPGRADAATGDKPVPSADRASCTFIEVTARSGIRFKHESGGYGEKLLPETMGAGAAFFDYDGDQKLDVFLVNSDFWPGHAPAAESRPSCALYRGRGDGTFEDRSSQTKAGISLYGMGAYPADYDGDGDDDLFITAVGDPVLLRNDSGVFEDVTLAAGLAGRRWTDRNGASHPEWSTAAAWFDADRDGDLDLFVANYVEWEPRSDIFTTLDGVTKAFTTPDRYNGLPCRIWLNDGNGAFSEPQDSGLSAHRGKALGVALWDFNKDGLMDVAVANDTRPNFLFINRGAGSFEEQGVAAGVAYDDNGRARAGMGIDIADYANDGVPGIAIGNFSSEPISLYRFQEGGGFRGTAEAAGLAAATYAALTFGLGFFDADLDGIQDLMIANGHIEPDIARIRSHERHAQSPQLFLGLGAGHFSEVTARAGTDFNMPRVGRGLCHGDIDGDGDVDCLITTNDGPCALLQNQAQETERRHFSRVRLAGKGKNTRGIGAVVSLKGSGKTQTRMIRTGSSYLSQSETTLTFGLGDRTDIQTLTVVWPDGTAREYPVKTVDTTQVVAE